MPVATGDVDDAGFGVRIGCGLANAQGAEVIEALGEQAGKEPRHVLHDEDGQREGGGNFGKHDFEGSGAAGRDPKHDEFRGQRGGGRQGESRFGRTRGGGRPGLLRKEGEDLGEQLAGEGLDTLADAVLGAGFGDVVGGTAGEGFNGDAGAARGEGAAHDDGDVAVAAADRGENFEAVHAGHLDVEQDEVGVEAVKGG
jgi:hypothetical protein